MKNHGIAVSRRRAHAAGPRARSQRRALALSAIPCAIVPCAAAELPPAPLAVRVYPIKAVRLVVAAPPGGSADRLGRLIAARLSEAWSHGVVVDNRPGANGIIGIQMTARAAPDGYTLALVAASIVVNPSLYAQVPYHPVNDFAPVTQLVSVPSILVVHASFAATSVGDLVAQARARPGTIAFGSAGRGSAGHLALELFQSFAASRFVHVPQKSGAAALNELLNTHVHALFGIAIATIPHVNAGRLKGLAVTGAARSRAAPDLPTIAEAGFPAFEMTNWYGVLAPAKTPAALVEKLHDEILRALNGLEREGELIEHAADPVGSAPAEFAAHIAAEARKWSNVIRLANIKLH